MKKIVTVLLLALIYTAGTYAQGIPSDIVLNPSPNQVTIGALEVNNVLCDFRINYQIKFGKNVQSCNVNLKVSNDGGKSFAVYPTRNCLSGDIGKITTPGYKQIRYDITRDKAYIVDSDVVFEVDVTGKDVLKTNVFILGQCNAVNCEGVGLMLGFCRKVGGYVKLTSNFVPSPAICGYCDARGRLLDDKGQNPTGDIIWTNGSSRVTYLGASAGVMFRLAKWLYPYAGLGYSGRNVYFIDISDVWYKCKDYSTIFAAEAGLALKMGKFSLSAGLNTQKCMFLGAGFAL